MGADKKGFTLIELMIVVAVLAIIMAMAIPNLMRSKMAANEAGAIQSLRTIVSAEDAFRNGSGTGRYGSLAELRDATPAYIDPSLGSGVASGYTVSMVGTLDSDSWSAVAVPNVVGTTGNRGFFIDQSGVIRYTTDGSQPNVSSPQIDR